MNHQLAFKEPVSGAFGIQERFEAFHKRHPEVYEQLLDLCIQWRRAGRSAWSIKGAWEVLRWQRHVFRDPGSTFLINNDYTSRYARLLVREHPELEGLFEMRELRS